MDSNQEFASRIYVCAFDFREIYRIVNLISDKKLTPCLVTKASSTQGISAILLAPPHQQWSLIAGKAIVVSCNYSITIKDLKHRVESFACCFGDDHLSSLHR